jgi:anti-anti-sigma factor
VTSSAELTISSAYRTVSERGGLDVLLNFSAVDHLDSSGIALIIGLLTESRQRHQRLLVTGLTQHYQKIFDMMGLTEYAPVLPSEDAAREWAVAAAHSTPIENA